MKHYLFFALLTTSLSVFGNTQSTYRHDPPNIGESRFEKASNNPLPPNHPYKDHVYKYGYTYAEINDGYISQQDAIWSELQLWLDIDANGVSTIDEMMSLQDIGINELGIMPKHNNRRDKAGNLIPLWSWAKDNETGQNTKWSMCFLRRWTADHVDVTVCVTT